MIGYHQWGAALFVYIVHNKTAQLFDIFITLKVIVSSSTKYWIVSLKRATLVFYQILGEGLVVVVRDNDHWRLSAGDCQIK